MQKFTLTSEADNGVVITYTFESEYLPGVQQQVDKFLEASGFVLPEEEDDFEFRVKSDDFLAAEEDYMWDEALVSKFGDVTTHAAFTINDGILGSTGADVITLSDFQLGDK